MILNHTTLTNYFSTLATNLKDISSFFRMDMVEIQGAFRSSATFPCMVSESHEGNFNNSNAMQSVNTITFAFTIFTKPAKADFDDQNTKLGDAEDIGLKIIARMRHDAATPSHLLYNKFKVTNVQYAKVGPTFNEQLYGYRFIGTIQGHEPLVVNPDDWNDAPTICN
jgi:hypothetical protein